MGPLIPKLYSVVWVASFPAHTVFLDWAVGSCTRELHRREPAEKGGFLKAIWPEIVGSVFGRISEIILWPDCLQASGTHFSLSARFGTAPLFGILL